MTQFNPDSLTQWQSIIGRFAQSEFGPTPADVHAVRLVKEAMDIVDHATTGRPVGDALAGVLVVLLAMADQADVDLPAALKAEHQLNLASQWRQSAFGHWNRVGTGAVRVSPATAIIAAQVHDGLLDANQAACLLVAGGASPKAAREWLISEGLVSSDAFETATPTAGAIEKDRTPRPSPLRAFADAVVVIDGYLPDEGLVIYG